MTSSARCNQAEKGDKALGKLQRAGLALEGVGEVNLFQLPGPIFYDLHFKVPTQSSAKVALGQSWISSGEIILNGYLNLGRKKLK